MTPEEYLKQHGLSADFVKNQLAWSWDESTITLPHFDTESKGLFNRYRHLVGDTKFSADKGSHATLYGGWLIKNKKQIVFCEGEPDTAKMLQEGFSAVTAGGVATFSAKLAEPLRDKEVIVLLDNDEPGQNAIAKYCDILVRAGATPKIAQLPEGVKDVCEYFVNNGDKEGMQLILLTALPYDLWLEQNEPEEFSIISAEEILTRELPPQEWLIDRMIPAEGFTFIVGSEGTGKSFDALTMANAIATGEKWLSTFEVKKMTKVLFIDKESVIRRIQNRMRGLQITGKGIYYLEYPQYFALYEEGAEFSNFSKKIQRFVIKNEIGLVVIDSFADIMLGNENSVGDTQVFFDGFRQLLPECSIIVLHHPGKPSAGVTKTSAQKSRGSTNIMAQVYSAFYTEAIPRSNNTFSFEHIKAGDTEKLKKFKIEMEVHKDLYDENKTTVTGLRYAGEIEDEEMKQALAEDAIMEALSSTPEIAREELENICVVKGISNRTFQDTIKKLKEGKIIDAIPNPENKSKRNIVLL